MSKINSREKGKRGERSAAHFLSRWFKARRGQQFKGSADSPDVIFDNKEIAKLLHVEVKRNEALNLEKAWQQANDEAPLTAWPIVLHRKNRTKWKVTIDAEDFMELFYQWYMWGEGRTNV
jgi:hypothetical protein